MENIVELKNGGGQIIIYQSKENNVSVNVRLEEENVWLTQQQMAELFQTSRTNVVEHIKHIYEEEELTDISTCRKFRQVQLEGNRFAEIQAMKHRPMYMEDYINQLDKILASTGESVLLNAGTVSHEQAVEKALAEYRKYQVKTLSPVEQAYLETIKKTEKVISEKSKRFVAEIEGQKTRFKLNNR